MPWETVASALMPSLMLPGCAWATQKGGRRPQAPPPRLPVSLPPREDAQPIKPPGGCHIYTSYLTPLLSEEPAQGSRQPAVKIMLPCSTLRSQPHLKLGRSLMW